MRNAYDVVSKLSRISSLRLCHLRLRLLTTSSPNNGSSSYTLRCFASDPNPNPNIHSLNKTISRLVRNGRISEAHDFFDRMKLRNVVSWNSLLSGYVKSREIVKARKLFDEMPERDIVSWNLIISGYVSFHDNDDYFEEGKKLFELMPERDSVSWNTMLGGYLKNGKMCEALGLFNTMPHRDVVCWNTMITWFVQNGDFRGAVSLFEGMPERSMESFSTLVSVLVRNGELDEAARVLNECEIVDDHGGYLVVAYNSLIAGYGQKGRVREAQSLFDKIPCYGGERNGDGNKRFERNVVSWNAMMMCYLKANYIVAARQLFNQMNERDTVSWNTMITGYVHVFDMEEAFKLFCQMPRPDVLTWNLMVSGFAGVGELGRAREIFHRMPQKNLVSWNSIIAGHEKNEHYRESIYLFVKMQFEGERYDRHTLSSILSCSTGLVDLHLGKQIHQLLIKTFIPDAPLNNALVTMYSRCGAIREARKIFDEMNRKDVISWNAMIGGYGSHGFHVEALQLFELMRQQRVKPTLVTFIAVLNTCANAGLVEEGRRHFGSMINEFGIKPRLEHYAALVDIIGRYGRLEEAMDVINTMPIAPDISVWGALLGACRVHNNAKLAQLAAEALARLQPESSAPYVTLYNIYAYLGQWDDAAKVRLVMEKNNVIKVRGSSRFDSSCF